MNFTAPYILLVMLHYLAIIIANALLSANKYGTISYPIPFWVFIIGYFLYVGIEHINQAIKETYKSN